MSHPRLYIDAPLHTHAEFALPEGAARHLRVLRMRPGAALTLFDGEGGECNAELLSIGRHAVRVRVGARHDVDREARARVALAVGMPANERMDWLVEKATELGAAAVQPLVCERAVLRLAGERAERRRAHWQAIAIAAAEQSGRTRVPQVEPVRCFDAWLAALASATRDDARVVLSPGDGLPIGAALAGRMPARCVVLSGPEGGLTAAEEDACKRAGFAPCTLGPRVLRAETAPLAALAQLTTLFG